MPKKSYTIPENVSVLQTPSNLSKYKNVHNSYLLGRFKRRILHAPNRIAKLSACKMQRLNQLNATYFNSMRLSRIFD